MPLELESKVSKYTVSKAVKNEFKKHYPQIIIDTSGDNVKLRGDDQKILNQVATDLKFYESTLQRVPINNLCNTLENFEVNNSSQETLRQLAYIFLELNDPFAGLYISGGEGRGKTHIAVGLGKKLMGKIQVNFTGKSNYYDDYSKFKFGNLNPTSLNNSLFILDDFNKEPYSDDYGQILIRNLYDSGGRVIITSNYSLTDHQFDRQLISRMMNTIAIANVVGDDYRLKNEKWWENNSNRS